MRWTGNRESDNVEDRRSSGRQVAAVGGVGTLVIIALGLFLGVDPQKLLNDVNNAQVQVDQDQGGEARPPTQDEDQSRKFAATILAFTEEVWGDQFQKIGKEYTPPHMVLFTERVETGCGVAPSAVGPFYCPLDQTVYLDPTFFAELQGRLGGSDADFSKAYVIAHEVGHHVQNLLGYSRIFEQKRRTSSKEEANHWSVRIELQADYLAGVWAHYGQEKFNFIEQGDIESAIQSANAIGDDRLQKRATGFTSPENYTHGTSAQRVKWFKQGLDTGEIHRLKDIFEMPESEL